MASLATIAVSRPGPTEVLIGVSGVVDRASVEEIAVRLAGVRGSADRVVVIDLDRAPRYHYRVLEMLDDARRELVSRGVVLHVRGLSARSLTGLAETDLPGALAAYRASLGVVEPTGPWEPGTGGATAVRSPGDLELIRACVGLAVLPHGPGAAAGDAARPGVLGVADRLVAQSLRHLGADAAAVVLRDPAGRPWVASSSAEPAELVETAGAASGEGPAAECLQRGEPVAAPDLEPHRAADRWPVYAGLAGQHGFAAARALPIRPPAVLRTGAGPRTIGALALLAGTAGPMAAADLAVAQSFADLAAIAFATATGRPADGAPPG
jgi:GAF domain-containing protein